MIVKLRNVGPIRSAEVELERLTILVGPNGSGKTIFSSVAYAATRAVRSAEPRLRRALFLPNRRGEQVRGDTTKAVDAWEDAVRERLEFELRRCCFPDFAAAGREHRAGKGAAPRILIGDESAKWQLVFRLERERLVLERSHRGYTPPQIDTLLGDSPTLGAVERRVTRSIAPRWPSSSYYFPASRSGFMQTYGALSALVWGALGGGFFEEATVGTIPGTAADFLRFIAQAGSPRRPSPPSGRFEAALRVFESELLHGEIEVDEAGPAGRVTFHPHGFNQRFPIESAATSAAELAPLILYMRHAAYSRDAVFIDEPEAHLHPSSQVSLARALVLMSEGLFRVVVATHSEFLVSGLSNVLLERQANRGEGGSDRPRVGIFEFCPASPKEGVTVKPLKYAPESGFEIKQFADVADATFNRAVALYNDLHSEDK